MTYRTLVWKRDEKWVAEWLYYETWAAKEREFDTLYDALDWAAQEVQRDAIKREGKDDDGQPVADKGTEHSEGG